MATCTTLVSSSTMRAPRRIDRMPLRSIRRSLFDTDRYRHACDARDGLAAWDAHVVAARQGHGAVGDYVAVVVLVVDDVNDARAGVAPVAPGVHEGAGCVGVV